MEGAAGPAVIVNIAKTMDLAKKSLKAAEIRNAILEKAVRAAVKTAESAAEMESAIKT